MEITVSTKLISDTCRSCGGVFAYSEAYDTEARRLGNFQKMITCPYCRTSVGYGEGQHDKEKRQLLAQIEEQKKATLQESARAHRALEARDNALAEADHFRKSRDGMKGVLVKERKKVSKGICPCCTHAFFNLKKHMQERHPDYTLADDLNISAQRREENL